MKKFIVFWSLFLIVSNLSAQKYFTKTGTVTFEASVPSFEEVKAINNKTTAILNTETGEIAALCLIKAFRFKIALMEEHFNENYAESDTYPKATFKGIIEKFSFNELSEEPKEYTINGELTFHGKKVIISSLSKIFFLDGKIIIQSNFTTSIDKYNINLSKTVLKKVAKAVDVSINFKLIPKK